MEHFLICFYLSLQQTSTEGHLLNDALPSTIPEGQVAPEVSSTVGTTQAPPPMTPGAIGKSQDFESNMAQISVMMHCTELEQEMSKLKNDNQKLRRQIAKSLDASTRAAAAEKEKNGAQTEGVIAVPEKERAGAAALLAEQFAEVQEELERYKKERADLKRVILIEDWITTSKPGTMDEKYQTDLLSAYKSLYTQLDEEIAKKDKFIQKLKNENIYLKMNGGMGVKGAAGGLASLTPGGPLSLDPSSLETMDIDPSICYLGMFKFKQADIDFIVRFLIYGKDLMDFWA